MELESHCCCVCGVWKELFAEKPPLVVVLWGLVITAINFVCGFICCLGGLEIIVVFVFDLWFGNQCLWFPICL